MAEKVARVINGKIGLSLIPDELLKKQRLPISPPMFGSPITNRAIGRSLTNTTSTVTVTTRVKHVVTEDSLGIALVFVGWGNAETSTPDATVKASVELDSLICPVTFNGARTAPLIGGQILRSDSVGGYFKKGDVLWVRCMRTITSGATWIQNCFLRGSAGEGTVDSDAVDSASSAFTVPGSDTGSSWSALAVISAGASLGRCVSIIGDSISNGQNETVREDGGYMLRSLGDSIGVLRINNGGAMVSQQVVPSTNVNYLRRRFALARSTRYVWSEGGINDINALESVDSLKASLTRLWNGFNAAGIEVWQSTLTPWSSSTDSWATTTNQTPFSGGKHEIRIAINDWIRTKPTPLKGYFEVADVLETSRNSGIWKIPVSGNPPTTDGVHPSTEMHQLIASSIGAQVLTAFN